MTSRFFWTHDGGQTVDEFLTRTRPSIVNQDDTDIWVQGASSSTEDPERRGAPGGVLAKASDILNKLEKRIKEIDSDESIPARGKKGLLSKKQTKDQAQEKTKEELKHLSIESKWTVGKWLFFPRSETVDGTWGTLARSVASGPLKEAGVVMAKVSSTTPASDSPHCICLYLENVYDRQLVKNVLLVLLTKHGLEPSACKSDLYTLAGIDSKHPTRLRSSLWRPSELIEGGNAEILKLKEDGKKAAKMGKANGGGETEKASTIGADGIIASDSEDDKVVEASKRKVASPVRREQVSSQPADQPTEPAPASAPPAKRPKHAAMRYQEQDVFAGPEGDSDSD